MKVPVRFDRDGIEVQIGGRWRGSMLATVIAVSGFSIGLFLVIVSGPPWLAVPALLILIAPYIVLFAALMWCGVREFLPSLLQALRRHKEPKK